MLPAGIVIHQTEAVRPADTITVAITAKATRAQQAAAKQQERETTLAFIAKFEARLHELTVNPPAELSPVKLEGHIDALRHTIKDLRRQLTRRSKPAVA